MKSWWAKLQQQLGGVDGSHSDDETHAIEFAAASLLVEVGHMDMHFDPIERDAIRKSLTDTFSLDQTEVCAILSRAERENDDNITYHPHVETINKLCSPEQKAQIIEQLWRVAIADGQLDKYEEHYLRRVADLIHVPHRVLMQTKHKVRGS